MQDESAGLNRSSDAEPGSSPTLQSRRFLALYALAVAGGSASYAPFLTLLLPDRLDSLFGSAAVEVLSYSAFVGAVAASLSNILFGWLSDRTHNRRGWIVGGLVLSCGLLMSMDAIDSIGSLLVLIAAWQVSLNMMLAPLAAWAGDCVPDEQKGLLGGLLSLAPGLGALVGAAITLPFLAAGETRLIANAAVVAAMVLPAIIFGRPQSMPHLEAPRHGSSKSDTIFVTPVADPPVRVWRMWLARLLVQISEASLFAFLLLWLRGLDPDIGDNDVARIFALVLFAAVPVAIFAGRWSDRVRRPLAPLAIACAVAAIGLSGMALAPSIALGVAGYLTFGLAASVFLALHSSQTLRVLPRPERRGRDLGIFNLTNTIPSLVMPGIALALIPMFGFEALFAVLAVLICLAIPLLTPRARGRSRA